jgi:hypothetical protein
MDIIYLSLTATGLMPDVSVNKDHTFNNETAYLTKTAQYLYIARIVTVQYKYMNITKHKNQKIQKKHIIHEKREYLKTYMKKH